MKKILVALAAAALALFSAVAEAQQINLPAQIMAPATRSAVLVNSADQTNQYWRSAVFAVNVRAYGSGSYYLTIQGKDPVSLNYYPICSGTTLSAIGINTLTIAPNVSPVANVSCSAVFPQTWRAQLIGAGGPSMTISVGAFFEP